MWRKLSTLSIPLRHFGGEPIEKHFEFLLILNWRNGDVRVLKRAKRTPALNVTDIPIRVDLTLRIPEKQELTIKGEVKLSEAQICNIAIDAFDQAC